MRVLLLSRYGRLGSTSRLRFYQYLPYLREHGLEITVAPLLTSEYVANLYTGNRQPLHLILRAYLGRLRSLAQAGGCDLVWVEKEFLPWLPALVPGLMSTPYVADYDDAAFHRYDLHVSAVVRRLLGGKIDSVMRGAALVVAGNDYLADRARRAGADRVEILPTVVDADRYRPQESQTGSARDSDSAGDAQAGSPSAEADAGRRQAAELGASDGVFSIGWIGAPVTAGYLRAIEPALHEFAAAGDVRITVLGAELPFERPLPAESRRWTEETEVAELRRFDVGIMPLPDEPFERGKCGYKLIQYMACGLPVIASPVGVNTEIVEHGVNGFLADTQIEWMDALRALRADPALRRRMGSAGQKKVEARYSLAYAAPRLLEMLKSARKS